MNNKVYVVVLNSYEPSPDDGGCYTNVVGVFSTVEKTKDYCKQQISDLLKEYQNDYHFNDWHFKEDHDYCITDNYTEIGYYYEEWELDKIED